MTTQQQERKHGMGHFGCTERQGWHIEMATIITGPVFANNGEMECAE